MPRLAATVRATRSTLPWLVLGCWGWLGLGPLYLQVLRPPVGRLGDFYQDWGSSRNYFAGLPIYTEHAISIPRHLGLPSNPNPIIARNAHPPTAVLLTLPLARLSYPDAVLAWNLFSLVALLASLGIVGRELAAPPRLILPGAALLGFCHPLYAHLYQGQWTLVLLLLVTAAWALDRRGRSVEAGALLGLAAAIKLFPVYLFVLFATQRRFKPLLAGMVSLIAVTLMTLAVLGPASYAAYLSEVLPGQHVFRGLAYNHSVAGFWHKLFDPVGEAGNLRPLFPAPALARLGTLVCNLGITATVIPLSRRARTVGQRDAAFGLAVTAMLLVSPVTWDISTLLLLVPLALIAADSERSLPRGLALGAILVVLWVPQELLTALVGGSLGTCSPAFSLGVASAKFYALLGTLVMGIALSRKRAGAGPQPHPRARPRRVARRRAPSAVP